MSRVTNAHPTQKATTARPHAAEQHWEFEVQSRFLKKLAWILAVVVMIVHIIMSVVVAIGDTGVAVTIVDQLGFIGIGLVFAGVALSLLRPRVRANAQGVEVRNIVNAQFYPWEIVYGLSFPGESKWARLELPDFEFVPMMALNIYDKDTIAQHVQAFRVLEDRYMPDE